MKKYIAIILLGIFTTGCSVSTMSTNPKYEWLTGSTAAYGDKEGDVCYTCGENFIFIPNEDLGSLKSAKRNGFQWGCNSKDCVPGY
jgi:PBP1b-binding outer membrane lipoprotein LpoB|tara:strand:- start:153 stop:410 length:258 start_codon:yes stop_codon:yes gene_type:complete